MRARSMRRSRSPRWSLGALRAFAQQLKWQQLRYGPIDPALWGQISRMFALAEARGIAEARTEYLKAAMFSAASPDTRPAAELELAERIIAELAPAFVIAQRARARAAVLDRPREGHGADAQHARAAAATPASRYFGPGAALGTLQNLSERLLAKREIPAELKPQPEDDHDTVLGVLRHLAMYWAPAAPERKHKRHNVQSKLTVAHGFDGVIEALGGDPDDSLNFGARVVGDEWAVDNVSAGGFGALAPQAKSEWVKVGALVAAQPEGGANWLVGTVRRVSQGLQGRAARRRGDAVAHAGARRASRCPACSRCRACCCRPSRRAPATPQSRCAPASTRRGENLECHVGGKQHIYMPQGVAERGDDYEIVKFKEMVRES